MSLKIRLARLIVDDKSVFTSVKMLECFERADYRYVHREVMRFIYEFTEFLRDWQIPMYPAICYAPEWGRRPEYREEYAHGLGFAVDFAHLEHAFALSSDEYIALAVVGQQIARRNTIPIVWGGCTLPDGQRIRQEDFEELGRPEHWELRSWWDCPPPQIERRFTPRGLKASRYPGLDALLPTTPSCR